MSEAVATSKQPKPPRISVVMVSYFTGPALFEALSAVTEDPDIFEVVLVDNGNPVTTREELAVWVSERPTLRIAQGHGNVGFSRGCNYGAALARGTHILFLNPDAVLQRRAAMAMVKTGRKLSRPWICGGLLLTVEGHEQRGSRRDELTALNAFTSFTPLHKLPFFRSIHREHRPLPLEPVPMPVVSGAMMLMDRESFDVIGGFDEGYFLHVEDLEICRRVRKMGGEVWFVPGARTKHYGSTSKALLQKVEWWKTKGFLRYFWTYNSNPLRRLGVIISAPFMILAIMGRAWWLAFRKIFQA